MPATLASFSRAAGRSVNLAGVEEDIRHIHDQAARRIAGLQNRVELLQQLDSQFHLLGFQLGLLFGGVVEFGLAGRPLRFILALQAIRLGRRGSHPRVVLELQAVGLGFGGDARFVFALQAVRSLRGGEPGVVLTLQAIGFACSGCTRFIFGLMRSASRLRRSAHRFRASRARLRQRAAACASFSRVRRSASACAFTAPLRLHA